ncbi:NLR family CARD domain-containing protein 4 isoform X2 [Aquarana catesbeiana]|uniref:NLR family CARD domain-containing protein 4 isoform X2 n=1 Tax=Aquarana catesbeiana TaxID=8400 RepID=UPI003CCA62BC
MDIIRSIFCGLTERISKTISKQIACDLYATEIFTLEEMNYVLSDQVAQEVARRLVTSILNKGEESCRYFLQSLENKDRFLFHSLMGKNVFGRVTDDDLEDLARLLKRLYNSKFFQNIFPLGKEIDIIFDLETTFTDPLLWKKDILNQRKEQITLEDLLHRLESPCIIEGEAGKGKTTILKRIAYLWASGKCESLIQYKLVFFITLRSMSVNLYETMCDQLFPVTSNWNKQEFMHKIWNLGPNVLFLLDGYDEFSCESCAEVDDLIKHNYKFGSTAIVTTRTESLKEVRHCASLIVETSDFTIESAKKLISNVLQEEDSTALLQQLDETDFMKNLMKTPLFVVIACALRMGEYEFHMNTQTTLFCTLYNLMIERSHYKLRDVDISIIEQNITFCGNLALKGLFAHKFEFRKEHLGSIVEDILLKIGLLNMYGAQKPKPIYRFFHTSFQEYTAGKRLAQLLSSEDTSSAEQGECYLNNIQTVNDVTNRYKNLLFYTCGSSRTATQKVINHIRNVCKDDISDQSTDFVDFGINLFYESATKTELSREFEFLFFGRTLHINTYNIAAHHVDFFEYLPSCLSVLQLVKLDLFGSHSVGSNIDKKDISNEGGLMENKPKTYISEKVVKLFFDWTQALQTLEVTLKNFDQLNKHDIKCLGKICCCADHLRLNICCSIGITGSLAKIVEYCKRMQDLIIDRTPLSTDDETRIVEMTNLKILSISNINRQEGGDLLHGLCNLVEIEKLVLHNIHLNEKDAEILAYNLKNTRNLEVLDLSDNYLEDDGKQACEELGIALTQLPALTTLKLPGGSNIKGCLDKLMCQLKGIPSLSNLAFKRWNMTDDDVKKLATHLKEDFKKISFLDLSCNNVGSDGWISLIEALQNLKNLRHFDLSTENIFIPIAHVVQILCSVVWKLPHLSSFNLSNWELDILDLSKMKNAKLICRKGEGTYKRIFKVENI